MKSWINYTFCSAILSIGLLAVASFAGDLSELPREKTLKLADNVKQGIHTAQGRSNLGQVLADASTCFVDESKPSEAQCILHFTSSDMSKGYYRVDVKASYLDGLLGESLYSLSVEYKSILFPPKSARP